MSVTEAETRRGKELQAITNSDFCKLWKQYKHMSARELDAVEPFFLIVAMQKLEALVNGMKL